MRNMRKLFLAIGLFAIFSAAFISCDTNTKDVTVLPAEAQTVLKNDFKSEVSNIEIDKKDGVIKEYEVKLANGMKVDFDTLGVWKEIKAPSDGEVPRTLIPDTIMNYVSEKYPEIKVRKIQKDSYGYEVDLSNKTELKFDHNGGFLKVD